MYFVPSYYVDPTDKTIQAATVTHGSQTVTAAVHGQFLGSPRKNLMAVQFHPEKSSTAGLKALAYFVRLFGQPFPVSEIVACGGKRHPKKLSPHSALISKLSKALSSLKSHACLRSPVQCRHRK